VRKDLVRKRYQREISIMENNNRMEVGKKYTCAINIFLNIKK
jgi:hypothetical protein